MKNIIFYAGLMALITGCGEDIASNHKQATNPVNDTPAATAQGQESSRSQIHRDRTAGILSTAEEITLITTGKLPNSYRPVPSMIFDNEGSHLNVRTVSDLGRPTVTCGTDSNFANITARIKDCVTKNSTTATWDGTNNGAAGESTWSLVTLSADGHEVWLDNRTGLVWSDLISENITTTTTTFNWCRASGNTDHAGTVDCSTTLATESLCHGESLYGLGSQVVWRLPTRNDYLQADINGLRSVVKAEPTASNGVWTATMQAASTTFSSAWVYSSKDGTLAADTLTNLHAVRCIGAPVR